MLDVDLPRIGNGKNSTKANQPTKVQKARIYMELAAANRDPAKVKLVEQQIIGPIFAGLNRAVPKYAHQLNTYYKTIKKAVNNNDQTVIEELAKYGVATKEVPDIPKPVKAKALQAAIDMTPPVSVPGLEVPDANPPFGTVGIDYKGQHRRAVLWELARLKDQGQTTFSIVDLIWKLVAKKFLPSGPSHIQYRVDSITERLAELGIVGNLIPWRFPVLKMGEVIEATVMVEPDAPAVAPLMVAATTEPAFPMTAEDELAELMANLNEQSIEEDL